ncbi:hypothetical protein ACFWAP_03840 [Streptomyces goshikiensis]|uniref:hypothetical protein n=1 Tax=Streptomyces goshikiensis TaxID=1942 RepID=UPI00365CCB19
MDDDDDVEVSAPTLTPCRAVRVTPYVSDGPDHIQAHTWRFEMPVLLAHVHRQRVPSFLETAQLGPTLLPGLVALLATEGHPQEADIHILGQGLWQRHYPYAGVEVWVENPGRDWMYVLFPRWARITPDGWTAKEGMQVHAAGQTLATLEPQRWPSASPRHEHYDIGQGTQILLATDAGPPPAAGFPQPATAAEHLSCATGL